MRSSPERGAPAAGSGQPPRQAGPLPDRHVLLGVSHPSDDPARHRVFEVRASYDLARGGWVARVGEQNLNDQRGAWGPNLAGDDFTRVFATPAACLGNAVAAIIDGFDQEAQEAV